MALALGIGIQNFPEGAAVALPLRQEGRGRLRAFTGGRGRTHLKFLYDLRHRKKK